MGSMLDRGAASSQPVNTDQQNGDEGHIQMHETRPPVTADHLDLVTEREFTSKQQSPYFTSRDSTVTRWQKLRIQLRRFTNIFITSNVSNTYSREMDSMSVNESGEFKYNAVAYDSEDQIIQSDSKSSKEDISQNEVNLAGVQGVRFTEEENIEWIFPVQKPSTPIETKTVTEVSHENSTVCRSKISLQDQASTKGLCENCQNTKHENKGRENENIQIDTKLVLGNEDLQMLPVDKGPVNKAIESTDRTTVCVICDKVINELATGNDSRCNFTNCRTNKQYLQAPSTQDNEEPSVYDSVVKSTQKANKIIDSPIITDIPRTGRPALKVSWSLDLPLRDPNNLETINENLILHTPPLDVRHSKDSLLRSLSNVEQNRKTNTEEIRRIRTNIEQLNKNIDKVDNLLNANKGTCHETFTDNNNRMEIISSSESEINKLGKTKLTKKKSSSREMLAPKPEACASIDSSKKFRLMRLFGRIRSQEPSVSLKSAGLNDATKPSASDTSKDSKEACKPSDDTIPIKIPGKLPNKNKSQEDQNHQRWRRNTHASLATALNPLQTRLKLDDSGSDSNSPKPIINPPKKRRFSKIELGSKSTANNSENTLGLMKSRKAFRPRSNSVDMTASNSRRHSMPDGFESTLAMFGRKSHADVKKSAIKVLDPKKENQTRLKHLRVVLESYDSHEAKVFFDQHFSHIYYVFYEAFTGVENDLRQRANKSHKEDLDYVLFIFEKILTLLPELIHKRWQYNSIGRIMKKLLHTGNSIKLRREGMRLFLIWYQILMDNALDECHQIYAELVPKLGQTTPSDVDIFTRVGVEGAVTAMEIAPVLLPQAGDEHPENLTKWLLELLLTCSVSEVKKIEWASKEMHEFCFTFLFDKFKEFYLLKIFPNFNKTSSIYEPLLEMPVNRTLGSVQADQSQRPFEVALCQEVLVKWLAIYAHALKNDSGQHFVKGASKSNGADDCDEVVMNGAQIDEQPQRQGVPGSNASTLSNASAYTEKDSNESSFCNEDQPYSERHIVCQVLYANKENVNMVHEVFRQAFLFPFSHSGAMRKVIAVYKEWFNEDSRDQRPPFFLELGDCLSEDSPDGGSPPPSSQPNIRASEEVKAGMQAVLQVFITNSANVFLLEQSPNPELLEGQVDMCKRVLNIYRYMVMHITMEQKTWEQLLKVLLRIVSGVLSTTPPKRKENMLGGKLAQPLFQTLIVTWIKANLNVLISAELWDQFLQVLSSLSAWVELIREWAKTMETITRVLAKQVYGLDLQDLPLNRLSEQKEKRRRGARPGQGGAPYRKQQRERTFSRGWSQHEMVEKLRAQLLRPIDPKGSNSTGGGPTIQRPSLAVSVPSAVNRHAIHSVSGLPMSTASDLADDLTMFRTNSVTGGGGGGVGVSSRRQRSRSGHSSPTGEGPVRSRDPIPEPAPLVRSNSDTSLMVNFEGSKEMVFDDDDRASLPDDPQAAVLADPSTEEDEEEDEGSTHAPVPFRRHRVVSASSTYYSASEDMDEEDVLFAAQCAAQKHTARMRNDSACSGADSVHTSQSPRGSRETESKGPESNANKLTVRKASTISTVSLGDTSFNLEEATNIVFSRNTSSNFESIEEKEPSDDIRNLRSRLSKEDSFDYEDESYCSIQPYLEDITETPKVLETDLDDLSNSSDSTVTSSTEKSENSQKFHRRLVPRILVSRSVQSLVSTDAMATKRAKSRESSPRISPKAKRSKSKEISSRESSPLVKPKQTHDKSTRDSPVVSPIVKRVIRSRENSPTVSEKIDMTLEKVQDTKEMLRKISQDSKEDIVIGSTNAHNQGNVITKTETNPETIKTDENKNKLIQVRVDEKGNVTRILLHDEGHMSESHIDVTSDVTTTFNNPLSSSSPRYSSRGLQGPSCMGGGGEEVDRSYTSSTVADDTSLASLDSSPMVPYQEVSTESSLNYAEQCSVGDRSDTEVLLRISESGTSFDAKRSSSFESPETALVVGGKTNKRDSASPQNSTRANDTMQVIAESDVLANDRPRFKDSPTPDRESLHIEETSSNVNQKSSQKGTKSDTDRQISNEEDLQSVDLRSILAGGNMCGWTPDVAVVMWRRLLGVLGDVNKIQDPLIHEQVFEELRDLIDTLNKIRDNLSVSIDNQNSPSPPEFLPPLWLFAPWLLECLKLPKEYKLGQLIACQLLCSCVLRRHDLDIEEALLSRFYKVLHNGLAHSSQDRVNVLVRHSSARFFSLPLSGSSMLCLDFMHAANSIASSTDHRDAPRTEAISILGALLCFPNHFGTLQVLDPESAELKLIPCIDMKDQLISILLKSGRKEPTGLARCISISCLGLFLYEEVAHNPHHAQIEETVKVLLSTLRFSNKSVAQVATDMLLLLCDHVTILLDKQRPLVERIVDSICTAIHCLLAATERSNSIEDKRLLVSIMFCLLEWTMLLPMDMLLSVNGGHKSLLYKIFRVLNLSVTGTQGTLTPRDSTADTLIHEDDLEGLREAGLHAAPSMSASAPGTPLEAAAHPGGGFGGRSTLSRGGAGLTRESPTSNIIKLAAKTVMSHLVKHLSHFPMGGGAARINSSVLECHDLQQHATEELTSTLFDVPTVQFFVVNNSTLMSFVEIPALTNLPGGGVTAGLTTGRTVTRVIMRDIGGRYAWDSSVLYGPPMCRAGSFPAEPVSCVGLNEDLDQVGEDEKENHEDTETLERDPEQLPLYTNVTSAQDSLDELLAYIGHTSPECQLYTGESLNVPFHAPVELTPTAENKASQCLTKQHIREMEHGRMHVNDVELRACAMKPTPSCETSTPFHLCRLFINQIGYLQWGKRPHFDLLKKSDALRRELKHLDNQISRETHKIAVIYVAKGQEDKTSVLNNHAGSAPYEEFVSGLGWEVDLEHHPGFLGGLATNKSTGVSAPYYATSTKEVLFHVSTRMAAETEELKVKKLRHLGNDEVQIIWSEHTRDYRRGIIPTEFGDVLIIIYPLHNGLYRIHIDRKPEVPYFGPLFDGALVPWRSLVGLVRATALNASAMLRTLKTGYLSFYEERAKCLENLVQQHKEKTTFEDFAAKVFAPVLPQGETIGSHLPEPVLQGIANGQPLRDLDATDAPSGGRGGTERAVVPEKHSPLTSSKNKESEGISMSNKRWSFGKGKKSVTRQVQQQQQQQREHVITPPRSPNSNYRG